MTSPTSSSPPERFPQIAPAILLPHTVPAILALADGTVFRGRSIGAAGQAVAEVVFNTAITGYQEILTDPSYAGQFVTLTYPHIGNVGINSEDVESNKIWASGLIIRDLSSVVSNFRSEQTLDAYLTAAGVVGISDIDTRKLTRLLRDKGAQNGCIQAGDIDETKAIKAAQAAPSMAGLDLAKVVSCAQPYQWSQSTWALGSGYGPRAEEKFHVVAYDYGVKFNILRMLAERGCKLTVVPAQTSAKDVLALNPDGVFLANGPGDPQACDYAIAAVKEIVDSGMPTFGICLGHQLLTLASGGKTLKMKNGHHGANHPVKDLDDGRVLITSQNHGFAGDPASLPANVRVTHVSLFDGTLQGIQRSDQPAFSFQGHPEASSGPHDVAYLFDRFINMMRAPA